MRNQARELVQMVYKATQRIPTEERERLGKLLRNEAVVVSSLLIEGSARMTLEEQTNYFLEAYGSLNKISNYIIAGGQMGHIPAAIAHLVKLQLTKVADTLNALVEEQQKE